MEILADRITLWEALGPDGIADPYPNGRGFYEQRQNAIHNDRVEEAILLAIASKNYQELGEILYDQAITYAEKEIAQRQCMLILPLLLKSLNNRSAIMGCHTFNFQLAI